MSIRASDIPKKFDSKLEEKFFWYMQGLKDGGVIKDFWYQPLRFRVGGSSDKANTKQSLYTPDFMVREKDGTMTLYEVKGHWMEASRVRIRAAAMIYPFKFVAVTWEGGVWTYEIFTP